MGMLILGRNESYGRNLYRETWLRSQRRDASRSRETGKGNSSRVRRFPLENGV